MLEQQGAEPAHGATNSGASPRHEAAVTVPAAALTALQHEALPDMNALRKTRRMHNNREAAKRSRDKKAAELINLSAAVKVSCSLIVEQCWPIFVCIQLHSKRNCMASMLDAFMAGALLCRDFRAALPVRCQQHVSWLNVGADAAALAAADADACHALRHSCQSQLLGVQAYSEELAVWRAAAQELHAALQQHAQGALKGVARRRSSAAAPVVPPDLPQAHLLAPLSDEGVAQAAAQLPLLAGGNAEVLQPPAGAAAATADVVAQQSSPASARHDGGHPGGGHGCADADAATAAAVPRSGIGGPSSVAEGVEVGSRDAADVAGAAPAAIQRQGKKRAVPRASAKGKRKRSQGISGNVASAAAAGGDCANASGERKGTHMGASDVMPSEELLTELRTMAQLNAPVQDRHNQTLSAATRLIGARRRARRSS